MAKFKVGDKVRILDGSNIKNYTGSWCPESMEKFVGEVDVIEKVIARGDGNVAGYYMEHNSFIWDERGLELVKQKRKFKVGDKIVANKKASSRYGYTKEGWIGRVTDVYNPPMFGNEFRAVGLSDEDGDSSFGLEEKYFDLVKQALPQKIVITTDGKQATAVLYDGKNHVKEESAVCSDDDTFDFMAGAKIAFERLTEEKEPERDLRELLKNGTFGKDDRWGMFVVVGENLVFKDGGYERIENYSSNLEATCSNIDEIYGDSPSFRYAESGFAELIWKRKEIK